MVLNTIVFNPQTLYRNERTLSTAIRILDRWQLIVWHKPWFRLNVWDDRTHTLRWVLLIQIGTVLAFLAVDKIIRSYISTT